MVVDTSVLVAIIKPEPDWRTFVSAINRDRRRLLSASSYLEAVMVLTGQVSDSRSGLDRLLERLGFDIVGFSPEQGRLAADAFERYGKGRAHPAGLNFGDCMVYALAKSTGEPLLFKGDDFTHTDVARVL